MRSAWPFLMMIACGPAALEPFEEPSSALIHSDRSVLRDEADRVVVMHGVNARVQGIFDVTFDDGRLPLEDIPPFEESDAQRMREMGLVLLRLPIHWSAIEPDEGSYDEAYLDGVQDLVEFCARSGVHVILDFHQDAYSKEIGEDGAPLWAILPPPDMLLGGPLGDSLSERLLSDQVQRAYATFFSAGTADTERLQGAFAAMARHVAQRFAGEDHVLGYDLYNEPVIADEYLPAFHERVGRAIREVDTEHLLLFEPSGLRNVVERAATGEPFFDDGGVYALHVYTFVFSRTDFDLSMLTKEDLASNFRSARREAASWDVPMLVGEWGIGPDATNMDLYVRYTYDLLDETLSSSTVWLWKEQSQGSWGFYDYADGTWTERDAVRRAHARIYAERIAGEPVSMTFDAPSRRFELVYEGRRDAAPHWIVVPAEEYPSFTVSCDGRPLDPQPVRDAALSRVSVVCAGSGEHTLVIDAQ